MKNGLAIWHYPHRTVLENVAFFAQQGFDCVSILGYHMNEICADEAQSAQLAELLADAGIPLTVHHKLPLSHEAESVASFKADIDRYAAWQKKYGLLSILSFDVGQAIRDNMAPYVEYVLGKVPQSKIAVEDFGLNAAERAQIEHLKEEKRFGYLLDIGHMYIRLCGKNESGLTLFTNSHEECSATDMPSFKEFLAAFRSKEFPIFEIHLHNNDGINDMHYFLDDGTLDIKMIASVLKEVDFDGILTIESAPGCVFECVYPESDKRILESYALWKRYIGV